MYMNVHIHKFINISRMQTQTKGDQDSMCLIRIKLPDYKSQIPIIEED